MIRLYRSLKPDVEPRETEKSSYVAKYWTRDEDAYSNDVPEKRDTDVYRRYCNLTAERILYRCKIMSLEMDDAVLQDNDVLDAKPLGGRKPTLREMMDSHIDVAMAFVPITPKESAPKEQEPTLARLYCVTGLEEDLDALPFTSDRPKCCEGHSWFLAGYDANKEGMIDGRSWWLAAHLLADRNARSSSAYKKNLASKLIVTGDVDGDRIKTVKMDRKTDLAKREEAFRKLTWIIPFANKGEQNMIKVEYPESLAECKEFIKSMQNKATKVLCMNANKGLRSADTFCDLLQSNADPTESVELGDGDGPKDRRNAMQRLTSSSWKSLNNRWSKIGELSDAAKREADDCADEFMRFIICERELSFYGSATRAMFLLARLGDVESVKRLADRVGIDTTDEQGETALDFAYEHKESGAINILEGLGAKRRGIYELESLQLQYDICELQYAIDNLSKEKAIQHILDALDHGLSPNEVFRIHNVGAPWRLYDYCESSWRHHLRNLETDPEPDPCCAEKEAREDEYRSHDENIYVCVRRRYTTNVFLEALYSGSEELIMACLEHGASLDAQIETTYAEWLAMQTFDFSKKDTIEHNPPEAKDEELFAERTTTIRNLFQNGRWSEFRGVPSKIGTKLSEMASASSKGNE